MTAEDIEKLIRGGEKLNVEFKSDLEPLNDNNLVEAVVALSNTDGGILLEGVEDSGEVTGLHPTHLGCGTPTALIANRTTPAVKVSVEQVQVRGHEIFVIDVPMAQGLVGTTGGYYARRRIKSDGKPEDVPMGPYELQQRMSSLRLIDPSAQPMPEISLESIDVLQRERMRAAIRRSNTSDKSLLELSDKEFDAALGLVRTFGGRKYLTLTGALMLTSEAVLKEHVPTHEVAFQALEGTDVRVNDHRCYPIVEAFDNMMGYMKTFIREQERMVDGYRCVAPNYDLDGYREALVNALVHRDYARLGTVIVKLDDTGLTLTSPGGFVEGVTQDNILTVEPLSRNRLLADVAKRIGLAERTGRGVDKIYAGTLRYGRPAPSYAQSSSTKVRLHIMNADPDFDFLEMIIKEEHKLGRPLPFDALVIMSTLRERRRLDARELAHVLQKDVDEASSEAERLVERGLLEPVGTGAKRAYILSASVYHRIGKETEYVRQAGFSFIQQEQMVLNLARSKQTITRTDVRELCKIDNSEARNLLRKLIRRRDIVMEGSGRAAHYRLFEGK